MKFQEILLSVLEDFEDVNLHSKSGRELLVKEMMVKIKDPSNGWFLDMSEGINEYKKQKSLALNGASYS